MSVYWLWWVVVPLEAADRKGVSEFMSCDGFFRISLLFNDEGIIPGELV